MSFPELCGWLASAMTMGAMIPQTLRVVRFRHDPHSLLSLSVLSAAGRVVTVSLWLAYTIVVGAVPLMIANSVLLAAAAIVLSVLVRSRAVYRARLATGLA